MTGPFCAACGQRTASFQRPLRHLGREVVADYLGFDGKLWRTARPLLAQPGFLTNAYLAGRRNRYVRPVRLYLSASVLMFFLVSVLPGGAGLVGTGVHEEDASLGPVESELAETRREIAELDSVRADLVLLADSLEQIAALPERAREGDGAEDEPAGFWSWFDETMDARSEQLGEMGEENARQWFVGSFTHNMPKAMFVLLPLFALLLKLLYVRRSRYYGEHLVFALHTHAFAFVLFAALAMLRTLTGNVEALDGVPRVLVGGTALVGLLAVPAYVLLALRRVYRQGWFRTLAKGAVLLGVYIAALGLSLAAVIVLSLLLL